MAGTQRDPRQPELRPRVSCATSGTDGGQRGHRALASAHRATQTVPSTRGHAAVTQNPLRKEPGSGNVSGGMRGAVPARPTSDKAASLRARLRQGSRVPRLPPGFSTRASPLHPPYGPSPRAEPPGGRPAAPVTWRAPLLSWTAAFIFWLSVPATHSRRGRAPYTCPRSPLRGPEPCASQGTLPCRAL